jgi:hypothetical protein
MRDTDWTPSIVPGDEDRDVCLVVNDFGRRGRAYCETDVEATDLEIIVRLEKGSGAGRVHICGGVV